MVTIVGPTLPEPYYGTVESVWDDLVERFGIDRYANPYPHVTLYALDDGVDIGAVETALEAVTDDHGPFPVHTDGVGVFPGNHVWIPVARSPQLTDLHRDVVAALEELGTAPTPYYEPRRWFPHVGLALDLDAERAGEVVSFLLDYDLEWDLTLDNVTVTRPSGTGPEHDAASVEL